jgi:hypothetical protein
LTCKKLHEEVKPCGACDSHCNLPTAKCNKDCKKPSCGCKNGFVRDHNNNCVNRNSCK